MNNGRNVLFRGIEHQTYLCENCEFVLEENVIPSTYVDIVFECLSCKSYNEITNTWLLTLCKTKIEHTSQKKGNKE